MKRRNSHGSEGEGRSAPGRATPQGTTLRCGAFAVQTAVVQTTEPRTVPWLTFLASGLVYLRMVIHPPYGILRISPRDPVIPNCPCGPTGCPKAPRFLPLRTQAPRTTSVLKTGWIPDFRRLPNQNSGSCLVMSITRDCDARHTAFLSQNGILWLELATSTARSSLRLHARRPGGECPQRPRERPPFARPDAGDRCTGGFIRRP